MTGGNRQSHTAVYIYNLSLNSFTIVAVCTDYGHVSTDYAHCIDCSRCLYELYPVYIDYGHYI